MAWSSGEFMLAEGASVTIDFNWEGQYKGTQFAQARPTMDAFIGKVWGEREVRTTEHALRGRRESLGKEVYWTYSVKVENMSSDFIVFFDLTGGEVEP
jgi:hypothetical protein